MSDVSIQRARRSKATVPLRVAGVATAVLGIAALAAMYFRIGWWRMESACSLNDAHGQIHQTVSYGWSWNPLGFQCAYNNGKSDTSLWF